MITVGKLIEKLRECPEDMLVVLAGFNERGYDNLGTVKTIEVVPVQRNRDGPDFEAPEDVEDARTGRGRTVGKSTAPPMEAIFLDR